MAAGGLKQGPVLLLLGPRLRAVSGVSAHLQTLLCSRLAEEFVLEHFQIGSEGRGESRAARWLRRLLRALLRRILALPDAIVVLAESELAAYRRFVPNQRITLVPNAVDCIPYLALPRKPSATGPLALLYLGRLAREKGLYELLQGLATARARGALARLTVVGSGPEEAQLRRAVVNLG